MKNEVQHYNWGSRDDQAFIAHLLGIPPEDNKPFAELWMGVHPKAPSFIIDPENTPQKLADWISEAPPEHLGYADSLPPTLPYLLKVLSAGQALSIQAHPNKSQAQILHRNDPEHYPDDNHKPEIAIAIDYLDALVGFISHDSYQKLLATTPEIFDLLQHKGFAQTNLKAAILYLLELSTQNTDKITSCITSLQNRFSKKIGADETELLFLELVQEHGTTDVGLIFLFFLNRVHLGSGEAVYLPPGIPHAYLKGNIIECMANSDNVVRLGLTEKFCDAPALSQILNFDEITNFNVETTNDGYLTEYLLPVKEFAVKTLDLLQGESRAFSFRDSLSMFLVLDGEISLHWGMGTSLCTYIYRRGDSFITPANLKDFHIQAKNHSKLFLVDIPKG